MCCHCPPWVRPFPFRAGKQNIQRKQWLVLSLFLLICGGGVLSFYLFIFPLFSLPFVLPFCNIITYIVLESQAASFDTWYNEIFGMGTVPKTLGPQVLCVVPPRGVGAALSKHTCWIGQAGHMGPTSLHMRPRGNFTLRLMETKLQQPSLARAWAFLRHWEET